MQILLRLLLRLDVTTILLFYFALVGMFSLRVAFLFIMLVSIGEESIERIKG